MLKIPIFLVLIAVTNCFYIDNQNSPTVRSVNGFGIIVNQDDNANFPAYFKVRLSLLSRTYKEFKKIERDATYPISGRNVYTVVSGKVVNEKNIDGDGGFEVYREVNGKSFATLVRNEDFVPNQNDHPFRMLGTIYEEGSSLVYDILPVMERQAQSSFVGERKFNSKMNTHTFVRRTEENQHLNNKISDYVEVEVKKAKSKRQASYRNKRSNNGVPFDLYVETLVVTDYTVFNNHKTFSRSNDSSKVMTHMRVYFAHLFNGIAQRYLNSADSDLRLLVKLTNYLFLNTEAESSWTSSALHGVPGVPTYEGKEVVDSGLVLDAFKAYMESLASSLPFSYDHAIAFFNKDMWSSSAGDAASRSSVAGLAFLSEVCLNFRYSICEESGGFGSISTAAHEIGHNLGSIHDGTGASVSCPASDNYIMTPGSGVFQTNLGNVFRFSSCSVKAFKDLLLANSYTSVSSQASCLTNVPTTTNNDTLPGISWTPNDQCKARYGPDASFAHSTKADICTTLWCRSSSTEQGSTSIPGNGAAEGTICDSGKRCLQGSCLTSDSAPITTCPFGDDVVVSQITMYTQNPLPSVQMTCEAADNYGQATLNQFFCDDANFKAACCQHCKRYDGVTCRDSLSYCGQYSNFCNTGAQLDGSDINTVCSRTCQVCDSSPVTCGSTNLCQNGGTCQNADVNSTWIGYKCLCPTGYSGFLCETVNKCLLNPCQNGGTCVNYGSLGYICECPTGFSGYDCQITSNPQTTTTTSTIASTTTTTTVVPTTTTTTSVVTATFPTSVATATTSTVAPSTTTTTATTSPCSPNPCSSDYLCVPSGVTYNCICINPSCFPTTVTTPAPTTIFGVTTTTAFDNCASNPCPIGYKCTNYASYYSCFCIDVSCQTTTTTSTAAPVTTTTTAAPVTGTTTAPVTMTTTASVTMTTTAAPTTTAMTNAPVTTTGFSSPTTTSFVTLPGAFNPCNPNPCLNQGTCQQTGPTTAMCLCPAQYTGAICERANTCSSNPCQNGATCRPFYNAFRCDCAQGFAGLLCNIDLSATCTSRSCFNGGTCSIVGGKVSCACTTFFKGEKCETSYNPCLTDTNESQCQNGGTCSINFGISPFYQCRCRYGYSGPNCQNVMSTTTPLPYIPVTCEDRDSFMCPLYAANNYCSNLYFINGQPIPTYCAKSCNTCGNPNLGTTAKPCVDSQPSCVFWGSSGNCYRLPNPSICAKSCGLC